MSRPAPTVEKRSRAAGGGRAARGSVPGLLAATGASVAANAMVAVLVPWLVLSRTGSATQAGLVGSVALAAAIPALLFGGPLIDRWGRRAVSVGADLMSAVAVAALPVIDATAGLTLVTTLALVGAGAVFDGPGAAAREVARPEVAVATGTPVERVNARGEAVEGVAGMVGPALAGAGIGLVGAMTSLWAAAVLFVIAAGVSWWSLPAAGRSGGGPARTSFTAGLRLVLHHPTLRAVAAAGAAGMAFVAPLLLVLTDLLATARDAAMLGAVTAALAAGTVAGALAYGAVALRVGRRAVLLLGVGAAGVATAAMAALAGTPLLIGAAAAAGIAFGPINPILAAVTQDATDPAVRGRVVTLLWSLSLLAGPLAVAATGLLLDAAGPVVALAIIAAGLLATTAYVALSPGLRRIERADLGPPAPTPPHPQEAS